MVDYKYSELYKQESVDKQLNIAFDSGNIANEEIHSEQFELTESLCSDAQLRFGSCEASMIKFRISNIFIPLKDKWLTVTETLNHNTDTPFKFGKYKVYSDTPTANRRYRDVVAYDQMYDIINADLTEWYNSLFPTDSTTVTLKEFRTSLMNYLGVEQEDVTLVNDDMVVKKTIQPTQLAGRDVISAICEINGCFGHIGRDGKFHYVFLAKRIQGLYPANDLYPQDNLFPREQVTNKIDKSLYIDCQYEDYLSQEITKLQIRQEENDIGKTYPGGETTDLDNTYVVQGNFLVYGKEETELEDIAKKLFSVISGTEYRPYEAQVVGNPCFEVGDAIRFNTSYQIVESYILKRTLTGVQGLRDELSADGEEYLSENAGGIESQIQQLKGKSNVLERNINETVSKISDVEQGLQSEIRQTAESITQTVEANYETKTDAGTTKKELQSEIKQTADEITQNVSATYETIQSASATKAVLESQIEQTAESITSTVSATYETKTDAIKTKEELQSQIEQTAESITQTVSKSTSKYDTTGYDITLFGYGTPDDNNYLPDEHNGEYYLDQETGKVYLSNGSHKWIHVNTLKLITEELSSRIEQTISSISLKINNGDKTAGIVITLENEDGTKSEVKGTIDMTGLVTFTDLLTQGQTVINGSNITTGQINCDLLNGGVINGQIYHSENGNYVVDIRNGIASATQFTLLEPVSGAGYVPGLRKLNAAQNAVTNALYLTDTESILAKQLYITRGSGGTSTVYPYCSIYGAGRAYFDGAICPDGDEEHPCGSDGYKWSQVYAKKDTINTSDKNKKNNINTISDKYEQLFFEIKPVTYMFNNGDRVHIGAISQDVEESMKSLEISDIEFAGFCKDVKKKSHIDENGKCIEIEDLDENGNEQYNYGLRYGEFIMLNTHMIQKAYKKIETQQQEIEELKKSVSFLMQKIGGGADE